MKRMNILTCKCLSIEVCNWILTHLKSSQFDTVRLGTSVLCIVNSDSKWFQVHIQEASYSYCKYDLIPGMNKNSTPPPPSLLRSTITYALPWEHVSTATPRLHNRIRNHVTRSQEISIQSRSPSKCLTIHNTPRHGRSHSCCATGEKTRLRTSLAGAP